MMKKLDFLMVIHNHQPCDNFGWVFEEAYKKTYEPFISILEKYPKVKIAMHYSGSLLEWFLKEKKDFLSRIKSLVTRKQLVLLSGGFYEPIFPVIPDRDKIGQINLLGAFLREHLDCDPKGLWIPERVWEGNLSNLFLGLGLEYAFVDENNLRWAGVKEEDIHGYYELENGFKVFAGAKLLRYIIPFARINQIKDYFRKVAQSNNQACIVFADDGEKFGLWPHTYNWVYKKKWLNNFFEFISDDKGILESVSIDDIFKKYGPSGRVDIPPSSYSEMMEWSGGDFNNFFEKYPEANLMHNRMLRVSKEIDKLESHGFATSRQRSCLEEAKRELYKAQSGCAYWHGIFGGFYFNHLRAGIYQHIINAQRMLEGISYSKKIYIDAYDFDGDHEEEIVIGNRFLDLYLKPERHLALFGLDHKKKSWNMVNIITRNPEPYHYRLFRTKRANAGHIKKDFENNRYTNIYDILGVKDRGLRKSLIYDEDKKHSVVEYVLRDKARLKDFLRADSKNLIKLAKNPPLRFDKVVDKDFIAFMLEKEEEVVLKKERFSLNIKKEYVLSNTAGFSVEYTLKNLSSEKFTSIFAIEFNWSIMNGFFLKRRKFKQRDSFFLKDEWTGIELRYKFSEFIRLWAIPIYTINETDAGLSKTYQYLSLLVQYPVSLESGESKELVTSIAIE